MLPNSLPNRQPHAKKFSLTSYFTAHRAANPQDVVTRYKAFQPYIPDHKFNFNGQLAIELAQGKITLKCTHIDTQIRSIEWGFELQCVETSQQTGFTRWLLVKTRRVQCSPGYSYVLEWVTLGSLLYYGFYMTIYTE